MKSSKSFWTSLTERFVGGVFLVSVLPTLLLVGFIIHSTAGYPVLITDEYPNGRGAITRRLRFRTTGPGTDFFRVMGRFLRTCSIDELPRCGVWCVEISACGNFATTDGEFQRRRRGIL